MLKQGTRKIGVADAGEPFPAAGQLGYALPWPPSVRLSVLGQPADPGRLSGIATFDGPCGSFGCQVAAIDLRGRCCRHPTLAAIATNPFGSISASEKHTEGLGCKRSQRVVGATTIAVSTGVVRPNIVGRHRQKPIGGVYIPIAIHAMIRRYNGGDSGEGPCRRAGCSAASGPRCGLQPFR